MVYEASFYGKTKGAIGISYTISTTVEADDKEQARIKLYDRYESVLMLKLEEMSNDNAC